MKAVILNGSRSGDPAAEVVHQTVLDELEGAGWTAEDIFLPDVKIATCMGDFKCWTKTPGVCIIDDANRDIAGTVANSDLLIFITRVTFGGYSSELKKAVDHLIQNISPFFANLGGEIHHQRRYARNPRLLAFGLLPQPDEESERIFKTLVWRNAINLHAPAYASGIIYSSQGAKEIRQAVKGLLAGGGFRSEGDPIQRLKSQRRARQSPSPGDSAGSSAAPAPSKALLLVGSPRRPRSSSESLGSYLLERLSEKRLETERVRIYASLRSEAKREKMLAAADRADLVVLAFPLYWDSLPAPVIQTLELMAKHRETIPQAKTQRFLAISNCGFPEAFHINTALAICCRFARQTGFEWAGGLALGAGEGIVTGRPLKELGGQGYHIIRSLDLAAAALAGGKPVPQEAVDLMAKPVVPPWLFAVFGGIGWKQQAKKYGVERKLRERPYETQT